MTGGHLFHLNLHLTIGRVDIVELLLARGTHITLHLSIEHLVKMQQISLTTQEQAQVVETTIYIMRIGRLMGPLAQPFATHQPQGTKVEIITDGPQLVVNHRMSLNLPFVINFLLLITVGINHGRPTIRGHFHHALQGAFA